MATKKKWLTYIKIWIYENSFNMNARRYVTLAKLGIILGCCTHVIYLVLGVINDSLGANPIEVLTHQTGEWGLNFLMLSLAVTPLRRLLSWNFLQRFRRLLGLCSFVYVLTHLMIFFVFDHLFDWCSIVMDIVERPYITLGFVGFVLMLPLALTSLDRIQRAMGKRWLQLHRWVYLVGVLGVLHYLLLVKADLLVPMLYAAVLIALLLIRVYYWQKKGLLLRSKNSNG